MKALRRLWRRLGWWTRVDQDEQRLREEFEDHIARQTADNIDAGLAPAEARRQALLKFGGVEAVKETYRDQRGLPAIETLVQDVRLALRRLRLAPGFTITTVITLALGIGATTSIFTLVHAVLLKSLPVAKPEELYRLGKEAHCCYIGGYSQDGGFSLVSYDLYKYLRDHTPGFAALAAFPAPEAVLGVRRSGSSDAAQTYPGEFVSGNYFATFDVRAYVGRALTMDDDRPGAQPVAVMSYRLWRQKYGSDPFVIGGVFNLNDRPFTVVGITPPGFYGDSLRPSPPDFYLPLNSEPLVEVDADINKADTHWLELIGRIEPGVNVASVEASMRVALKQWLQSHWGEMSPSDRAEFPKQTLHLSPGGAGITRMREQYEYWLKILMTASGLVLLIACANVANLMLVRGLERRRQIAMSMALGARASRVMREALAESTLLALFGGTAGLAVAFAGARLILRFAFPSLPGFAGAPVDASPSAPVLAFAFGVSIATGIAFGIAPAWMATRVDPIEALRGAGRSTARAGSLGRKMLVVLQAALSLVLLSAAGLLTGALLKLEHRDFGFEQEHRMVVSINPRLAGYRTDQLPALYRRIHDSFANISGVSSVALCSFSPQSGDRWGGGVWVDGRPAPGPHDDNVSSWDRVGAGYLEASGNALLRGRGIQDQDTGNSQKVAVINEAFARKFFGSQDPIGRHFGSTPAAPREFEVVGVARDARYFPWKLDEPVGPLYFTAAAQADYGQSNLGSLFLHDVIVLTKPGAGVSIAQIHAAMASADPNLPVISIQSLKEQVAAQFIQQRLIARLTSLFGVLALVLASIGLYGVTAYNAGRRAGEIGVRMALGADRGAVVALVLRGALALIAAGLLIGLPLAFAAGRLLSHQLYGMNPYDARVAMAAIGALGFPALIAAFIPALRASSISPVEALRRD